MEEEDEGDVDETGVEPKDVELVMTQVRPTSSCFLLPAFLMVAQCACHNLRADGNSLLHM